MMTTIVGLVIGTLGIDEPNLATIRAEARPLVDKATAYFRGVQADDGSFAEGDYGPAVTALAITGLLRNKNLPLTDPMIAKGLAFLEKTCPRGWWHLRSRPQSKLPYRHRSARLPRRQ